MAHCEDGSVSFEAFEWDENKNVINAAKHGIDFADALKVFSDPNAVMFESSGQRQEQRRLVVGMVDGILVTVVFTVHRERIRIISARRSRTSERRRYGN